MHKVGIPIHALVYLTWPKQPLGIPDEDRFDWALHVRVHGLLVVNRETEEQKLREEGWSAENRVKKRFYGVMVGAVPCMVGSVLTRTGTKMYN